MFETYQSAYSRGVKALLGQMLEQVDFNLDNSRRTLELMNNQSSMPDDYDAESSDEYFSEQDIDEEFECY